MREAAARASKSARHLYALHFFLRFDVDGLVGGRERPVRDCNLSVDPAAGVDGVEETGLTPTPPHPPNGAPYLSPIHHSYSHSYLLVANALLTSVIQPHHVRSGSAQPPSFLADDPLTASHLTRKEYQGSSIYCHESTPGPLEAVCARCARTLCDSGT